MAEPQGLTFNIEPDAPPRRIDRVIADRAPELGSRGAKRLVAAGLVLLDGEKARPMRQARGGQTVEIIAPAKQEFPEFPRIISKEKNYYFFFKPAGMHSAPIAGNYNVNFEELALELAGEELFFLQRLDFGTSGIICAARNKAAQLAFRQCEAQMRCRKHYLAILGGNLREKLTVKFAIKGGATKSAVTAQEAGAGRWTRIEPLYHWASGTAFSARLGPEPITLAACAITAGQRHQIRVHAAACGHPLAGDGLYGEGEGFYLEHFRLLFPGHDIISPGFGHLAAKLPPPAREAVAAYAAKEKPAQGRPGTEEKSPVSTDDP